MSGIGYVVLRSVRGLSRTIEKAAAARGWGGQSHQLFPLHAKHGIAEDGALLVSGSAGARRFHSGEVSLRPQLLRPQPSAA